PQNIDGLTLDDINHFQPAKELPTEPEGQSTMSDTHSAEPTKVRLKRKRSLQSEGGVGLSKKAPK
ncbi:hypothetical protein DXG01_016946, partial [Tephrocybe rancida]